MPDNVSFQTSALATPAASTVVSTEEVTTLNGGTVSAQHVQRVAAAIRTETDARVAAGAMLEWQPHETSVFEGARADQTARRRRQRHVHADDIGGLK